MNFVNLTPHTINIIDDNGEIMKTFEPSGCIARCKVQSTKIGEIDGICINKSVFGQTEGIPDPEPDTVYLVSSLAAQGSHRDDLYVPDGFVRDESGVIIGCRFLSKI